MIQLIMADLLSLLRKHKAILFPVILSIACSFTVFSMMTGVVEFEMEAAKKTSFHQTFTLDMKAQLIREENYNEIFATGRVNTALLMRADPREPLIVGWYGRNDNRWFVLSEGRFFDAEEIDADVAVISQNVFSGLTLTNEPHELDIHGSTARIVGLGAIPQSNMLFIGGGAPIYERYYPSTHTTQHQHDYPSDEVDARATTVIVPAKSFFRYGLTANVVRIEYLLDGAEERDAVWKRLQSLFPSADIVVPDIPVEYYQAPLTSATVRALLIIGCGFVNLVALFTFWLNRQRRVHTIYLVLGLRRVFVSYLIAVEWLVLMLAGYLGGLALQAMLAPLMKLLYVNNSLTIRNSLLAFGALYLMSILLMLGQVRRNSTMELEAL